MGWVAEGRSVTSGWEPRLAAAVAALVLLSAALGWAAGDYRSGAWFAGTLDLIGGFTGCWGCGVLIARDYRRHRDAA